MKCKHPRFNDTQSMNMSLGSKVFEASDVKLVVEGYITAEPGKINGSFGFAGFAISYVSFSNVTNVSNL